MSNISHKDFACLLNIKEAIEKIYEYTADHRDADTFNNDSKSFDAVMMNFVVIGEMSEKLSAEFRIETDPIVGDTYYSYRRNVRCYCSSKKGSYV